MGHLYSENIARFFIRRIYAKGQINIQSCVDFFVLQLVQMNERIEQTKPKEEIAKLRKEREAYIIHAADGEFDDRYTISMAFAEVASTYEKMGLVDALLRNRPLRHYPLDQITKLERYDGFNKKIYWRFATGGRKKYINKEIAYIKYIDQ